MAYYSFEKFDEKIRYSEAFQREAMRIAFTSGLPRKRVAIDLTRENERLRLENRMLREESDPILREQ